MKEKSEKNDAKEKCKRYSFAFWFKQITAAGHLRVYVMWIYWLIRVEQTLKRRGKNSLQLKQNLCLVYFLCAAFVHQNSSISIYIKVYIYTIVQTVVHMSNWRLIAVAWKSLQLDSCQLNVLIKETLIAELIIYIVVR